MDSEKQPPRIREFERQKSLIQKLKLLPPNGIHRFCIDKKKNFFPLEHKAFQRNAVPNDNNENQAH